MAGGRTFMRMKGYFGGLSAIALALSAPSAVAEADDGHHSYSAAREDFHAVDPDQAQPFDLAGARRRRRNFAASDRRRRGATARDHLSKDLEGSDSLLFIGISLRGATASRGFYRHPLR